MIDFHRLTLRQLSDLTGIDRPRWSRYLTGKQSMNTRTLQRAAGSLRIPSDMLLRLINERIQKASERLPKKAS
jgi:transcriptional regulator with XRE-family HTH domain